MPSLPETSILIIMLTLISFLDGIKGNAASSYSGVNDVGTEDYSNKVNDNNNNNINSSDIEFMYKNNDSSLNTTKQENPSETPTIFSVTPTKPKPNATKTDSVGDQQNVIQMYSVATGILNNGCNKGEIFSTRIQRCIILVQNTGVIG